MYDGTMKYACEQKKYVQCAYPMFLAIPLHILFVMCTECQICESSLRLTMRHLRPQKITETKKRNWSQKYESKSDEVLRKETF